jgi:phosphate uptake regulator
MLKELMVALKGEVPLQDLHTELHDMLQLTRGMVLDASDSFWQRGMTPEERTALYKRDVRVNKLERSLRKRVLSHLVVGGPTSGDAPYVLMVMSLVKDLERLGDYAKNMAEITEIHDASLPDHQVVEELRHIATQVEELATRTPDVFESGDAEAAVELTRMGRSASERCDIALRSLARTEMDASLVVSLALGLRFYKRIAGHLLNVLSGVLMPLHKLDYFDETALGASAAADKG